MVCLMKGEQGGSSESGGVSPRRESTRFALLPRSTYPLPNTSFLNALLRGRLQKWHQHTGLLGREGRQRCLYHPPCAQEGGHGDPANPAGPTGLALWRTKQGALDGATEISVTHLHRLTWF